MLKTQPETSLPELTAILLARLGFLWMLVLVSLLMPNDEVAFYAFMGIAFIITIPYSLWLRNKLRSSQFAPLQFVVDLVLVTGLVYFTGGMRSELTLLYPLVIISAGIVGTPKQAAQITVLTVVTYVLMAALLSNHWLVEYLPTGSATTENSSLLDIFFRGITFALFGFASIYISKRCNYIDSHQQELAETTLALISNIPSPALLLDKEGHILFANNPLGELLDTDAAKMEATRFSDWQLTEHDPIPDSFGTTTYLCGAHNKTVPVAYESRNFQLQETALLGSKGRKNQEITITLLSIRDISPALASFRQLEKVERITAATHIAGEMAHEIRTPLTAISASIQLLRHYEANATAADWLPNSPRRVDRKELFNHIEDASRQMDDVVKNFVNFAEFSPADLLSIIKLDYNDENKSYIGHLNTVGRGYKDGQNTDCG